MKTLIKAAMLYRAALPDADLVAGHLQEKAFGEIQSLELAHLGFVPVPETGEMVSKFEGGFAFALRRDQKVIPASAVKAETQKLADAYLQAHGHKPGRKARQELKEQAFDSLVPRALVNSQVFTAFYHVADQLLIVATSSKSVADLITGMLIQAIGSVEFSTIHVSEVKHGLTTRLKNWLGQTEFDDDAFGDFQPVDQVQLVRRLDGRKEAVAVSMSDLQAAESALTEAMDAKFGVASIRFFAESLTFTLTDEFRLRSLAFEIPPDEDFSGTAWQHEAGIEVLMVARVVRQLVELLSYKAPDAGEQAEAEFESNE